MRGERRAQLASCIDVNGNAGREVAENAGDPATRNKPRVADADGAAFDRGAAGGCANIDVIATVGEVASC